MPSPESDIDVMIEVENYTPEVEALIDELVFEINLNHDCLISAVIFGSKELHEGPLRESLSRRDPVSYYFTSVPIFSHRKPNRGVSRNLVDLPKVVISEISAALPEPARDTKSI